MNNGLIIQMVKAFVFDEDHGTLKPFDLNSRPLLGDFIEWSGLFLFFLVFYDIDNFFGLYKENG